MGVTVVISGSGRRAGKTAVGCALIKALPEWVWTAVKVTPDIHDVEDAAKEHKRRVQGASPSVSIEKDRGSPKSMGRYLAAGARKAVLVTVDPKWHGEPLAELDAVLEEGLKAGNLMVESNRFCRNVKIQLAVTGVTEAEWKQSFHRCIQTADVLVLTNGIRTGDLPDRLRARTAFAVEGELWAPEGLVALVRRRLLDANACSRR